ncbi:ExbD/TolR family protein [Facilibium subflavum]|uniref:ExbD/TolR family protein n=1 Tax=Facilibium subflavum TaxID=2219058 RepID=UPI000E6588D6|nr:biopolymer transporter ExbD [Facilibium subflavum]
MVFYREKKHKKEVESVFSLINIIFLLIVFFLVAGHISQKRFDVSPPLVDKAQALDLDEKCTIHIANEKLLYQQQPISNNKALLSSLAKTCQSHVLLATQNNAQASRIITMIKALRPYFNDIQLLVASKGG